MNEEICTICGATIEVNSETATCPNCGAKFHVNISIDPGDHQPVYELGDMVSEPPKEGFVKFA